MKADAAAQLRLLDLQSVDARTDQVRHRLATLPELAEIASLQAGRRELDDERRDAEILVTDLTSAQRKAEFDVEQVKVRRTRDQERMASGAIANPKDLERMSHELESLERRISTLEDEELEVMEQLEEAQGTLDQVVEKLDASDRRLADLAESRDAKTAELRRDLDAVSAERPAALEGLPEDLLALYERLRASRNGVGAAELRQRRCTGCQLGIDNAELAVIRQSPPDLVVRCEECTRILVRTAESGL